MVEQALALARTGAFFSNQGTPLSSRTVRAISRVNFPEGIPNQPAGALFGIENTNRGCDFNVAFLPGQLYPRLLNATGDGYGAGIATVPGGLPLFRDGVDRHRRHRGRRPRYRRPERDAPPVAAAQSAGFFVKLPLPDPGAVYLDGFRLPFVSPAADAHLPPTPGRRLRYRAAQRRAPPPKAGWPDRCRQRALSATTSADRAERHRHGQPSRVPPSACPWVRAPAW